MVSGRPFWGHMSAQHTQLLLFRNLASISSRLLPLQGPSWAPPACVPEEEDQEQGGSCVTTPGVSSGLGSRDARDISVTTASFPPTPSPSLAAMAAAAPHLPSQPLTACPSAVGTDSRNSDLKMGLTVK